MSKKIFSAFGFMILLNVLVKLYWVFGIEVWTQNLLGLDSYGNYFAILNYTWLALILADFGLTQYNTRIISANSEELQKIFPSLFTLKLILGVFFTSFLFSLAGIFNFSAEQFHILAFVATTQVLLSLTLFLRSNISALQLFKTDALLSVADKFIMGLACTWFIFFSESFTRNQFMSAQVAGLALAAFFALIAIIWKFPKLNWTPDFKLAFQILKKAAPYSVFIALMSIYTRMDGFMIEQLLPNGTYHSGVYASAYRLLDAASMFSYLLAGILLPIFSKEIANKISSTPTFIKANLIILIPCIILPLGVSIYKSEIYHFLYPNIYSDYGAEVLNLLSFSFIPLSLVIVFGTYITALGNVRSLNIISFTCVVLNGILNYWLIPDYQAIGASWATIATQGLMAISCIYLSIKHSFKL